MGLFTEPEPVIGKPGVKILHRTGLIPPSAGPVQTWCGRKVPIDRTGHVEIKGRKLCRQCARIVARKKRLKLWPWSKTP